MKITDQTGFTADYRIPCRRLVSLVPSITELLLDLGLGENLSGCTSYCPVPESFRHGCSIVGGPKDFSVEAVRNLDVDVVLSSREENDADRIKTIRRDVPVWTSDIRTLQDALEMIRTVGVITGQDKSAELMAQQIFSEFSVLPAVSNRTAAALIWNHPLMAAGNYTFIHEMMKYCGLSNCFSERKGYPKAVSEDMRNADVLLFLSEPYDFSDIEIAEIQELYPDALCLRAEGTMFSWYGSRMLKMPAYYLELREIIGI